MMKMKEKMMKMKEKMMKMKEKLALAGDEFQGCFPCHVSGVFRVWQQ
jgi:hypothetical protein